MTSVTKVVRLEEIDADGVLYNPSADTSQSKQSFSLGKDDAIQASYIGTLVEREEIENNEDDEESLALLEVEDKVFPLPENWPKIRQIFRRKSCELVSTTSPCVHKAASHLELIQNIIEEWFKEKERESHTPLRTAGSRKQLRFAKSSESAKRSNSAKSLSSVPSGASSASSLSIRGIGTQQNDETDGLDVPYLGAEEVIDEVITLLARLENDRMEAEKKLKEEKERVVRLNEKIDKLCLKRMVDMPAVVQREHEACIMDLNELQWHVQYSVRNQKRIENRTNIAEVLNTRLKDDIAFVEKHIPLVDEKLELELEAMSKIKFAQSETVTELDTTQQRQEKTASKSTEALKKATTERTHIKRELDTVKDALSVISEELSESKMCYNSYVHQVNDIQQQLKDNDQELKVLEVKNENAKVGEEMQARKVREIHTRIAEAEFEHQRLENENIKFQQELDTQKRMNDDKIMELEHLVKKHDSRLRDILLKNQEMEMEVQEYHDKIADCTRQKVADEKNVARIHKEKVKLQQQMTVTMEEYSKVQMINNNIREQLNLEQQKAFKTEESLKATVETLRRQVKDEVHTKTVLVARITSDSTELTKAQGETTQKRDRVRKVADEVLGAVDEVKTKVDKLKSVKRERHQNVDSNEVPMSDVDYSEIMKANAEKKATLKTKLVDTQKQHTESKENFEKRIAEIEPHHSHLKKDVLALDKRLDHMSWKTELMNKQMNDMDREQSTMDRLVSNTTKAIDSLTETYNELNLQLEAGKKLEDDLRADFDSHCERIRDNTLSHSKFVEERHKFMQESELQRSRLLSHNKNIASQYRRLQNEYLVLKERLLNSFEERVKLEGAIKDVKQLQALQRRMHGAMQEYFKYRGMYNKMELNRMEDETNENGVRVAQLQDQMEEALKNITVFIKTQMDGRTARRVAWEKMKQEQAQEQTQNSQPVMKTSLGNPLPVIPPIGRQGSLVQA